jgi:hypothetical protein
MKNWIVGVFAVVALLCLTASANAGHHGRHHSNGCGGGNAAYSGCNGGNAAYSGCQGSQGGGCQSCFAAPSGCQGGQGGGYVQAERIAAPVATYYTAPVYSNNSNGNCNSCNVGPVAGVVGGVGHAAVGIATVPFRLFRDNRTCANCQ